MEVSFTNANPSENGDSFLLRFENSESKDTACVLVDSGAGVDVDSLLEEDDHLTGILLTHGHADHYRSLPANHRSNVPVLTSPDTARILPPILRANADALTGGNGVETVLEHVSALGDGWVNLAPQVDVRAVPVGHAPGACGFVLRLNDGGVNHILVTGDFTRRAVAGNPPISLGYPADIDAVFFNAVVQERDTSTLTNSLSQIVEGVLSGGTTLVAAEGFAGIHYAHLLAGIADERDLNMAVTLAGRAGTLYDRLDRDHCVISTVPEFDSTDEVLSQGDVCIAGPSTLDRNSSHRLHKALKDDPCARVIAIGNEDTTLPEAVDQFPYIGHPSREDAEELIEALHPKETLIEHGNLDRYGSVFDFCYTWAIDESVTYRLYEDGEWHPPEWVGDSTRRTVRSHHYGNKTVEYEVDEAETVDTWPSLEAVSTTPEAEGVELTEIHGSTDDTGAESTTKYSTTSTNEAAKQPESVDTSTGDHTPRTTTDGGATAQTAGGADLAPTEGDTDHVERAERERLAQATESFLEELRKGTEKDGECEAVEANVITTRDGKYLLQVDEDALDLDLSHHESVTASIHTGE